MGLNNIPSGDSGFPEKKPIQKPSYQEAEPLQPLGVDLTAPGALSHKSPKLQGSYLKMVKLLLVNKELSKNLSLELKRDIFNTLNLYKNQYSIKDSEINFAITSFDPNSNENLRAHHVKEAKGNHSREADKVFEENKEERLNTAVAYADNEEQLKRFSNLDKDEQKILIDIVAEKIEQGLSTLKLNPKSIDALSDLLLVHKKLKSPNFNSKNLEKTSSNLAKPATPNKKYNKRVQAVALAIVGSGITTAGLISTPGKELLHHFVDNVPPLEKIVVDNYQPDPYTLSLATSNHYYDLGKV